MSYSFQTGKPTAGDIDKVDWLSDEEMGALSDFPADFGNNAVVPVVGDSIADLVGIPTDNLIGSLAGDSTSDPTDNLTGNLADIPGDVTVGNPDKLSC